MIGRILTLGLPVLAACQAVPKDVDVAPVDDPRDRGTLAVEFEICQPAGRVELQTIDVDISSYLAALDKSFENVPTDRRDERLKSGLPAMSASSHMAVRYAGSSLKAIDRLRQPNRVLHEHKEGSLSVFSYSSAFDGSLIDLTVSQQPVFHFWEFRYDEIIGIWASSQSPDRGYERYWFAPPPAATVPAKGFTAWQPPKAVENAAWRAAAHGHLSGESFVLKNDARGFPVTDSSTLPRIRYRLATMHEFYDLDRPWQALRNWLPSLIKQQYSVDVEPSRPTERAQDDLIRPQGVVIPACD